MSYGTATAGVNGLNTGVKGAFDIATMIYTNKRLHSALDNQMKLAKKHYYHMAEIISSREETSSLAKDVKLNTFASLEELARAEKDNAVAKERYTQAKITKTKLKMKTQRLRTLISSERFYGKPA